MLHFLLGPGMNRPVEVATRPKLALQSYLDALLYDATEVLEEPVSSIDEFQAAVLEEQAFDARMQAQIKPLAVAVAAPAPVAVAVKVEAPAPVIEVAPVIVAEVVKVEEAVSTVELVEPVAELGTLVTQRTPTPPPTSDGRPAWAAEPFECLLFDVAGLTLAVPLVCLGSIYPLAGQELTPLFGQPDWFLGILPCQAGNLKVLDTARWIMPDRYRDDFRQGLQYVISVQGYEWGLAVHQVSRSLRLDPNEIKWRTQRGQRPWLAGTVIEHMCALLDVAELAELIASGAVKQLNKSK
ncbi:MULTISPECIES: CheW domain-containing protein [Pseudomonas syringae group]|uniref:Chemotaxis protein CheW n=2 Tax=Pseudomonas syringae group TaxID=136849 RepID=A0A2K4WSP0_PSESX|nr:MULTISPECIES: CheW domain-containing protein [Pseudomonas syringae group]AVB15620.1 chemotaxis protein CheW [Pseudomonas amygdali pv. morsprunorum]KWS54477.1 chemotaxis protein CheW [Pseudomonas amygdali pv. morsprunorum]KWS58454.1 chemotaxis protein CheW [Pseudomonas amygdali pv. morsprunorum]MBI6728550.1 CheW domain-containing protein [Pseudomonas amygdali]MBI6810346.1 CheW domain-containing protein [Pseudomonas amygdali]